jgi:hypothetical protein
MTNSRGMAGRAAVSWPEHALGCPRALRPHTGGRPRRAGRRGLMAPVGQRPAAEDRVTEGSEVKGKPGVGLNPAARPSPGTRGKRRTSAAAPGPWSASPSCRPSVRPCSLAMGWGGPSRQAPALVRRRAGGPGRRFGPPRPAASPHQGDPETSCTTAEGESWFGANNGHAGASSGIAAAGRLIAGLTATPVNSDSTDCSPSVQGGAIRGGAWRSEHPLDPRVIGTGSM